MNLQQAMDDYNRLASQLELPQLAKCRLASSSRLVREPAALWDALRAFAPEAGWLQTTGAVIAVRGADDLRDDAGLPLAAELARGPSGLLLRRRRDGWWLLQLDEREHEGEAVAADEVCLLATHGADKLVYRRYWRLDEEQGLMPFATRFARFQDAEGSSR